jgi:magnesium chelatase subunit H
VEQRVSLLTAIGREPRVELALPTLAEAIGDASDDAARAAMARWVIDRAPGAQEGAAALVEYLRGVDARLARDDETDGLLRALDGRFVEPAPGADLLRNPDVLPTGRNTYGFDPYRVPSPARCATASCRSRDCSRGTWPTTARCPRPWRWCCGAPTT